MHYKWYTLFLIWLFLCSFQPMIGQSWLAPHDDLHFTSKPNPTSFIDLIGANAGKEIGQNKATFQAVGKIRNVRSFHIMGSDYGNGFFPNEQTVLPHPCDCGDTFYQCAPQVCLDEETGKVKQYGFRNWKAHYCDWKKGYQMKNIQASLEAIFPKLSTVCDFDENFNCTHVPHPCTDYGLGRNYPNKWYTKEEWGGSFQNIREIAAVYAENFAITFCPSDTSKQCLVDVLEVGNEPWGKGDDGINGTSDDTPGKEGYHAICWGVIDGLTNYYKSNDPKNWRMKLSTAAFEAYTTTPGCGNDPNQYIEVMVPNQIENGKSLRSYFDFVSIHNYPFPKATLCNDTHLKKIPESKDGLYLALKNMKAWMDINMPHAKLNITEFGWNTKTSPGCYSVGQANQASYLIRAFLLAARYDINKAYAYAFYDHPEESLFCSVGFQEEHTNAEKKSLKAVSKLNELIGDKHFIKALEEGNDGATFAYLIGDYDKTSQQGTPTHLVAWKATDLMEVDVFDTYPKAATNFTTINLEEFAVNPSGNYVYLGWDNTKDGSIGNNIVQANGNEVQIKLSGMPILIPLNNTTCTYDEIGDFNGCDENTQVQNTNQTELACGDITVTYGNGQIKLAGKEGVKYQTFEIINIADGKYDRTVLCPSNCDPIQMVDNLPEGDYLIKVFDASWRLTCQLNYNNAIHLETGGIANTCEDKDEDGICVSEDCDDNDPNFPKPVGSPCNDGNPNTENDKIQTDGCDCKGDEIPVENNGTENTNTLSCNKVQITYGNGQITLVSEDGKSHPMKVQAKQAPYKIPINCYNCGVTKTISDLPDGTYQIWVNYKSCGLIELSSTTEIPTEDDCLNHGGDDDNDGICNDMDCAPNDPNLPQPEGTLCDDGNPNTQNDKIQADGCNCLGEEIEETNSNTTTLSCGEININYAGDEIEMIGLANKIYTFSINDEKSEWKKIFDCSYNCGHTQKAINLAPSDYLVRVYHNNNEVCDTTVQLSNSLNNNSLSRNVLELATIVQQQAIQLEWLAGGVTETESFIIEKSMDGIDFKTIQTIQTINNPSDYHFKIADSHPDYGVNYYRIKQQFSSGEYRYSTVSSQKYYLDETSINLFPNPAKTEINLTIGHFANLKGEVRVFNRLGYEVAFKKLDGINPQLTFDTSNFENGMYFLIIEAENRKTISRKFMVEQGK